jgi:hypothetical protein
MAARMVLAVMEAQARQQVQQAHRAVQQQAQQQTQAAEVLQAASSDIMSQAVLFRTGLMLRAMQVRRAAQAVRVQAAHQVVLQQDQARQAQLPLPEKSAESAVRDMQAASSDIIPW